MTSAVREVGTKHFHKMRTDKKSTLLSGAMELMRIRRETPEDALPDPQSLNNKIRSIVSRDLRSYNTRLVKEAIEKNRGSKVFTKTLGRSHMAKLTTSNGVTVTWVPEILAEIEHFYGNLYLCLACEMPPPDATLEPRGPLSRHFTEDLPDIDIDKIGAALRQLKAANPPELCERSYEASATSNTEFIVFRL
ncbi:hypothetical protein NE865_04439 [Phthorimaea operculella]|nr:hypothetical protein NE865_04439 [Phthorimaea operculella]